MLFSLSFSPAFFFSINRHFAVVVIRAAEVRGRYSFGLREMVAAITIIATATDTPIRYGLCLSAAQPRMDTFLGTPRPAALLWQRPTAVALPERSRSSKFHSTPIHVQYLSGFITDFG